MRFSQKRQGFQDIVEANVTNKTSEHTEIIFYLTNPSSRPLRKKCVLYKRRSELNNVVVINNPLDHKSDKLSKPDSKRVIAVGRYVYQKGFDLLLEAWATVLKKHSDWHLYIYGYGDREPYIELAKKINILDNCHLNNADRKSVV